MPELKRVTAVIPIAACLIFGGLVRGFGAEKDSVSFSHEILPILSDKCFTCHGPDNAKRKGDLRLDDRDAAMKSGVIIPGKSAESELLARITSHDADEVMPPPKQNKTLAAAEIEKIRQWIDQGANWGRHWAWEKPARPEIPKTPAGFAAKNPIDHFVAQKLIAKNLKPQPPASKEQIARRLALDLTGLPPDAKMLEQFLRDSSAGAYEKLVEQLLASPRFGERMAWDWLDAARYADTNGYQGDGERTMWPWRDWVIAAFNADMPFDQFTVSQVAGDLLEKPSRDQVLATGFSRNHMINGEGGRIAEENRVEYVFDQTETVSTVWLGLTMTCARCHDHKFDPISKKDYFQLFAFFNQTPVSGAGGSGQTAPVLDMTTPAQLEAQKKAAAAYDALQKKLLEKEKQLREAGMTTDKNGLFATKLPVIIESTLRKGIDGRPAENFKALEEFYGKTEPEYIRQLGELRPLRQKRDEATAKVTRVMVMADMPKPRETFMLTRGTYDKRESAVEPSILSAFRPATVTGEKAANRLDLAQWLVSPENPLTARVTVNRLWQMLFGVGLVKTSEDFGLQGQLPSHPELLDYLAVEFQSPTLDKKARPWSIKHLIRLIVNSATYRQSASAPAELWAIDPENRLLARGPRHRLPSWMIRDQALAVSGLLTPTIGGQSVNSYQPPGIWEEATFGFKTYRQDHGQALYRRSLYLYWRRIVGPTIFFDNANRQTCSVKNVITNTPLHALTTLNDVVYVESARAFAQNALKQGGPADAERVGWIVRQALMRPASDKEVKMLTASLSKQRAFYKQNLAQATELLKVGESPRDVSLEPAEHAAWTQLCLLVLNLDETLSKP
jgi:cytochrome c553